MARANRLSGQGGFWGDNFHATLVEGGAYLWRCLCYIELNMVRCGRVAHPREWDWLGYHEIMGQRQRYRVLDLIGCAGVCSPTAWWSGGRASFGKYSAD